MVLSERLTVLSVTMTMAVAENGTAAATIKANGTMIKSKNQLRRLKAKQKKIAEGPKASSLYQPVQLRQTLNEHPQQVKDTSTKNGNDSDREDDDDNDQVEYVTEALDVPDSALDAFSNIFARFKPPSTTAIVSVCL